MTEPRRRQSSRPTDGQKAAREELAAARKNDLARKKRTRELIQLGEVCAHYGFTSPGQVDALLAALAKRDAWVEWLADKQDVDLKRETT